MSPSTSIREENLKTESKRISRENNIRRLAAQILAVLAGVCAFQVSTANARIQYQQQATDSIHHWRQIEHASSMGPVSREG